MSYKSFVLFCFAILLTKNTIGQTYFASDSSVFPKIDNCSSLNDIRKSYNFMGIEISAYYRVIDSLSFDLNNDKAYEKILILSPVTQEDGKEDFPCSGQDVKRLFVVLTFVDNRYLIDFVNENIVPNVYDYQSEPFSGIDIKNNTVRLSIFTGSKVKCKYTYLFYAYKGNMYLGSSKYDCYLIDLSKSDKRKFDFVRSSKYNLRNININDYLVEPRL